MTQYVYLDTMQNLCLRLSNAFKVCRKGDQPLIDLYDSAEEGFFNKKQKLLAIEAGLPISDEQRDRVEKFGAYVQERENEAAYILRDENAGKLGAIYEKSDCDSL